MFSDYAVEVTGIPKYIRFKGDEYRDDKKDADVLKEHMLEVLRMIDREQNQNQEVDDPSRVVECVLAKNYYGTLMMHQQEAQLRVQKIIEL